MKHEAVTTLEELDALDNEELFAGHMSAEKGDPEPGANHTRSFHHGWRTRMMDLGEIPIDELHIRMLRAYLDRDRIAKGEKPRWLDHAKSPK